VSDAPWRDVLAKQVRVLQLVVAAMISGILMFLIVVCLTAGHGPAQEEHPIVTTIALAMAALCVILRLIVPDVVVSAARRKILRGEYNPGASATWAAKRQALEAFFRRTGDAGRLMAVYMTTTVLAGAILEGAAFLLLVAYLVDRQAVSLAVAIAILVALAAHMPWRARVFAWIDRELGHLEQQRQFDPRS
jgi:hypothetical protein